MKVDISREGLLVVVAETIIEAWALNAVALFDGSDTSSKIIVDCSILNNDRSCMLADD